MERTDAANTKQLSWIKPNKQRRYKIKYPFHMHYQLRHLMKFDTFPIVTIMFVSFITFWIQSEHQMEPGVIYSAAAMNSIFAVLFYGVIYSMVSHGKVFVNYRRDYSRAHQFYQNHMLFSVLCGGVFLGYLFYGISQGYLSNDKQQYILILQQIWNPAVALFSFLIGFLIIYYTFYQDPYITSDKYNQMMSKKMTEYEEDRGFIEIIKEQDAYHKYSSAREINGVSSVKKTEEPKEDLYESVKIRRGD